MIILSLNLTHAASQIGSQAHDKVNLHKIQSQKVQEFNYASIFQMRNINTAEITIFASNVTIQAIRFMNVSILSTQKDHSSRMIKIKSKLKLLRHHIESMQECKLFMLKVSAIMMFIQQKVSDLLNLNLNSSQSIQKTEQAL